MKERNWERKETFYIVIKTHFINSLQEKPALTLLLFQFIKYILFCYFLSINFTCDLNPGLSYLS
jgi:hypothetical protein